MKSFSDTFTQGGQTQLHKLRMMSQVVGSTLKVALLVAFVSLLGLICFEHSWSDFWFLGCYAKAYLRLFCEFLPSDLWQTSWITWDGSIYREVSDLKIVTHPSSTLFAHYLLLSLLKKILQSTVIFLLSSVGVALFWVLMGEKRKAKKILKGTQEVSNRQLIGILKKHKMSSDLKLAGVPLIKDKENEHLLVVGTTGSGKTNCLVELMEQIRARGDRVILVDSTFELFERFHQDSDKLLNPLDSRSVAWNLWQDCPKDHHFHEFAECLIPQNGNDPFWSNSARSLFVETAKLLKEQKDYKAFLSLSVQKPLKEVQNLYAHTAVASLMNVEAEKTALSVRSTLVQSLQAFSYLDSLEPTFSLREWISNEEKDWLFLSCSPDQRSLLRPLISSWVGLCAKALMSLESGRNRKIWIIIDELPTLYQIPELPKALAEVRKYGGCFVLGLQNISQLEDLYGHSGSQSLLSLTGTKVFFRCADAQTAKKLCPFLGEQDIVEANESISFGAHQMRDGVSLTDQQRTKPALSSTDLLQLDNLQAYLKLPGNYPFTKLSFRYHG